jgi:hypothetical protein
MLSQIAVCVCFPLQDHEETDHDGCGNAHPEHAQRRGRDDDGIALSGETHEDVERCCQQRGGDAISDAQEHRGVDDGSIVQEVVLAAHASREPHDSCDDEQIDGGDRHVVRRVPPLQGMREPAAHEGSCHIERGADSQGTAQDNLSLGHRLRAASNGRCQ